MVRVGLTIFDKHWLKNINILLIFNIVINDYFKTLK